MNELLLSEINTDKVDVYRALALIEKYIFEHDIELSLIDDLAEHCYQQIDDIEDPLARAEQLINEIYVNQLFIDNNRAIWSVVSHQLFNALSYRIIAPIFKCVLLQKIITYCGFECDIVFVPEKTMVRVICDEDYSIIFDPVTGESISWFDLDERLADREGDPSIDGVTVVEDKDIVYQYVVSLKNALINEIKFDKALKCVDILLAMKPDDPFQRRDRGFLLQQLDCFKVAYDDYRYFVERCPQDPAAQLLKLQLDQISIASMVLH